jgi:uncharacterized membrane protein YbhN (UPF0104 family)
VTASLATIAAGLVAFTVLLMLRQQAVGALGSILEQLKFRDIPAVGRSLEAIEALGEQDSRKLYSSLATLVGYSLFAMVCTFLWAYCNLRAFSISMSAMSIIFVVSITQLLALIPVGVFGGLGVHEVTSIYLFGLFGYSEPEIVPVLLGLRALSYALNLALLLYLPVVAWSSFRASKEQRPQGAKEQS